MLRQVLGPVVLMSRKLQQQFCLVVQCHASHHANQFLQRLLKQSFLKFVRVLEWANHLRAR